MTRAKKSPVKVFGDSTALVSGPITIGIDPSLTGFAVSLVSVSDPGKHVTKVFTSPNKGAVRLDDIATFLDSEISWASDGHIQDVAIEGTVVRSPAASVLGEVSGVVKQMLWANWQIRPLQVPPMSLKKFVTGKGTGIQKNQMLLHTYKKFQIAFEDDNAADAYGLARFVMGSHKLAYEKEVYEKIIGSPKFRDPLPV